MVRAVSAKAGWAVTSPTSSPSTKMLAVFGDRVEILLPGAQAAGERCPCSFAHGIAPRSLSHGGICSASSDHAASFFKII